MNHQPLIDFVKEVAKDYKELRTLFSQLSQQLATSQAQDVSQQIEQAITALKNELAGGELDEALDTLKEIGDKLKKGDGVAEAFLTKLTELRNGLEELKQSLPPSNLVDIYNQAKQGS